MNIDRNVVLNIAKLAHLELEAHEVEVFTKQLGDILHYVEKLGEVKQSAEPFSVVKPASRSLRADETEPSLSAEEALSNAPARVRQFFKVPRIIP
jgi:aspartyl-tRNA(Asn)/glutamyl-tRNA(Gln) amidotransferase subunit C